MQCDVVTRAEKGVQIGVLKSHSSLKTFVAPRRVYQNSGIKRRQPTHHRATDSAKPDHAHGFAVKIRAERNAPRPYIQTVLTLPKAPSQSDHESDGLIRH